MLNESNEVKEPETVFTEEQIRTFSEEYDRLGEICYLDQTGCALYSKSLIKACMEDLCHNVYSNPHSNSIASQNCSDLVDQTRYNILDYFNTDLGEYDIIFTSGSTAALRIVAESFSWSEEKHENEWCPKEPKQGEKGDFVYMEDVHTSILGMREEVVNQGARLFCMEHEEAFNIFSNDKTLENDSRITNSLFIYSAQCNFSGIKYPLSWIQKVKNGALDSITGKRSNWFCMLDAATYVSTNKLDLGKYKPDFVCVSFYKIFGYPTGLGALLVKNTSSHLLKKRYYGGGTVLIALSLHNAFVPKPVLHNRFEDGTLNFLSIVSLNHGLKELKRLVGDMTNVSKHCFNLAKYVFESLLTLHHSNGSPVIKLYADTPYDDVTTQGNIVSFNVLRSNGDFVGFAEVLNMANLHNIQLRTGCFCNPGACRRHLSLSSEDVKKQYLSGHVCGDNNDLIDDRPTGSVRASFGPYTKKENVDQLLKMIENCFIEKPMIRKIPDSWPITYQKLKQKFIPENIQEQKSLKNVDFWYKNHKLPEESNDLGNTTNKIDENAQQFISHIFLYPVKSCGRFKTTTWELDDKGFKYDRQWMVTNPSGVGLTQKTEPRMCCIRPTIDLLNQKLILTCTGFESIAIDLEEKNSRDSEVSLCQSKVCSDRIQATDCGEKVADWLSLVLNRPGLRLIRQIPNDSRVTKNVSGLSLANQGQYLLINKASVDWLSDLLQEGSDCDKESMLDRFRSNLIVSGLEKFVEQEWKSIKIGNMTFNVDGPCARCQMICINQDTGEKTKEPLTTLAASMKGKLKFGIYLTKTSKNGFISVGNPLVIIS